MDFKDTFFSRNHSLNCGGKLLDLSVPAVMGILNITPDSFYDGGKYRDRKDIQQRIDRIMNEGADIIDVGAFSSRPGAKMISEQEEIGRLSPALEMIREKYPEAVISVDTFRSSIAEKVIHSYKADIINDITGGDGDPEMFDLIAEKNIPYILMHMQGVPETMQKNPEYRDVVNEVLSVFAAKTGELIKRGVNDVIIDPGFGFGKNLEHNYTLMSALEVFGSMDLPLLVGISRKSMVYRLSGNDPSAALTGTTALHMYALLKGANILRVHDVKEAKEVIEIFKKLDKLEKEA